MAKSLVVKTAQRAESRYQLLETIMAFAREQLVQGGTHAQMSERHAGYYLGIAEEWMEMAVAGPDRAPWLDRMERDHANFRQALGWAVDTNAEEDVRLRWAAALGTYWFFRGYFAEGRAWQRALDVVPEAAKTTRAWARALIGVAMVTVHGDVDLDLARASAEKALEIARAVGDELTVNRALNNLGTLLRLRGDYDGAIAALQEAVAGNREAKDRGRESLSSGGLSLAFLARGDCSAAQAAAETSLRCATELEDVYAEGLAYGALAEVARALGDRSSARTHYNASLSRTGRVGFGQQLSSALLGLACVDQDEGDWEAAATHFRESVRVAHELGLRVELVEALEGCSALAAVGGLAGSALELAGAAQATRDAFRIVRWPAAQQRLDRALVSARRKLGEADCEAALGRGRDMGLEAAVRGALMVSDAARFPAPVVSAT